MFDFTDNSQINHTDVNEAYDFHNIENNSVDDVAFDETLTDYINTKVQVLYAHNLSEYPADEEMETWPDACWKPKNDEELKELIKNLLVPLYYCNLNWIDTSEITDMHNLFAHSNFKGDISRWDVSHVKNMSEMFFRSQFNGDISRWDVSNVENMKEMFFDSYFNGDISRWDVSNVENMSGMFAYSSFNGDISSWDVSNVTDMHSMFETAQFNGDISQWNVSNVKNMKEMFYDAEFNGDISNWDVSNVENMKEMFSGSAFNGDISKWNVGKVGMFDYMFYDSEFGGDLTPWVKNGYITMEHAKDQNIDKFIHLKDMDVNEEYDFGSIKQNSAEQNAVDDALTVYVDMKVQAILNKDMANYPTKKEMEEWPDAVWTPTDNEELEELVRNIPESLEDCNLNWVDVSCVEDMSMMFKCSYFNGDISRWDVSNVKNMYGMFGFSVFNGDISRWNVSNVKNMQYMFTVSEFNGDISDWDVSNVNNMYGMFANSNFKGDLTPWVTNGYITMVQAKRWKLAKFINKDAVNEVFDFDNVDVDNAEQAVFNDLTDYIYKKAEAIYCIDKANWPTAEEMDDWPDAIWKPDNDQKLYHFIRNLISNFYTCNLNWIDTSDITNMNNLFKEKWFNGDISRWDVSKVESMECMFLWSKFNGDISQWNVSNVKDMGGMFANSKFAGDISKWDVHNVSDMYGMFRGTQFKGDISQWDVSNVKLMAHIFDESDFNGDLTPWITNGYITMVQAKSWGIDKFIHIDDIDEAYDFGAIESDNAESTLVNARVVQINSKIEAILNRHRDNYPTLEEMDEWPDAFWQPKSLSELRIFLYMLPYHLLSCNLNWVDTSKLTDMTRLFYNRTDFTGDISRWNTSNVKNMKEMFVQTKFTGDISKWDVSKVTNMIEMFAYSFFNGDISQWNVSNVKKFNGMFRRSMFNQDLTPWITNGYITVEDAEKQGLWHYMKSHPDYEIVKYTNVFLDNVMESYDFDKVGEDDVEISVLDATLIDYIKEKVKVIINGDKQEYPSLEEMAGWPDHIWKPEDANEFMNLIASIPEALAECNLNWVDTSDITDMNELFAYSKFDGDISRWNVRRVEDMSWMFAYSDFTGKKGDINGWDVSNVTNMGEMFFNSRFNGNISDWDVSNVENMFSMFEGSVFNQDISGWNVRNVKNMHMMFTDSKFNGDISNWVKKGYITIEQAMEWGIRKFININALSESYDFNVVDTENTDSAALDDTITTIVTNKVRALLTMDKDNYPAVGEMDSWPDAIWKPKDRQELRRLVMAVCEDAEGLWDCNLNWVDVSDLTDLSAVFIYCDFDGDISRWDVSNVKNMQSMFRDCKFAGDISQWDVHNVTNMNSMFDGAACHCDLSGWDLSSIQKMNGMFSYSLYEDEVEDYCKIWIEKGYKIDSASLL